MTSNFINLLALTPGAAAGIAAAIAIVVGGLLGLVIYRVYSQNKIGNAKREAARIIEEANLEAKTIRKDGMLEAKEQMNKMRIDFENETKERKQEWQRTENRLAQKKRLSTRKRTRSIKRMRLSIRNSTTLRNLKSKSRKPKNASKASKQNLATPKKRCKRNLKELRA